MIDDDTENNADSSWFYNGTECVVVVYSRMLVKAFCHQSGLEPVNRAIRFAFSSKNPLATNQILTAIRWN